MLLPLLQRFPEQMRVSLYHTPDLRGLLRLLVPERFNETIGVQHIKVYLFDNSLIISGYEPMDTYSYTHEVSNMGTCCAFICNKLQHAKIPYIQDCTEYLNVGYCV